MMGTHTNAPEAGNRTGSNGFVVFLLPLLLIGVAFLVAGWIAALSGARYRLVKLLCFPASFVLANAVGALLLVTLVMLVPMMSGGSGTFSFAMIADLSLIAVWGPLLTFVWSGEAATPAPAVVSTAWIAIYQCTLWWALGRQLARGTAIALQDAALVRRASAGGLQPSSLRAALIGGDAAYARDAGHYAQRRRVPLLGYLLVWLVGTSPVDFYQVD